MNLMLRRTCRKRAGDDRNGPLALVSGLFTFLFHHLVDERSLLVEQVCQLGGLLASVLVNLRYQGLHPLLVVEQA
jgi:hypothetical protein